MNKYNARKTEVDGFVFDSKHEAQRYSELKLLETAGLIQDLQLQPEYKLVVNGVLIGKYTADFLYYDIEKGCHVVEDAKSPATKKARDYPLRIKLMRALYGIEVREV